MEEDENKRVGVDPFTLTQKTHRRLAKIQNFLSLTNPDNRRPNKAEACETLILEGMNVIEKKMKRYVK